ncbi:hypothetical protein UACE39S_04336 [Ureibacillus acetophenoni]
MNWKLIGLLIACTIITLIPLEGFALSQKNTNTARPVTESKEIIVENLSESNITLSAIESKGNFINFKLKISGKIIEFPNWINVSNKTYWPQLFYKDINKDGLEELIIVLTTGYGTGVIKQDVHVLQKNNNSNAFKEVNVENPIANLKKNIKTELTKSKAIINIANQQTVIELEKLGLTSEDLFSDIVLRNLVRFDILDNNLTAVIGAQVSPIGGYIGDFYIMYEFIDNKYQVKRINFVPIKNS